MDATKTSHDHVDQLLFTDKNLAEAVFSCPMHPEVQQDRSGICPECGMKLIPTKKSHVHQDHDKHEGHSTQLFLKKFWVCLLLTIPVVLYSKVAEKLFGWSPPVFIGSKYLPFVLASIVFFYGGWVFIIGAWREIKSRLPGMMTLIAIAISVAYLWSLYAVFADSDVLYWELTTLITIMLLGHWLEMRAVSGASGALKELSKLLPDTAELLSDDKTELVPLSKLNKNDIVLVRPGGKIPADGEIFEGNSELNESMITGESKPTNKKAGDKVIAGTINGVGALRVKVTDIGERTFLAGVMRLVAEAQLSKSRLQMLSDRAALYLTVIAVGGGIITLIVWLVKGADIAFATQRLVAVFVIACPHALGLAIPLVAAISTSKAAKNGLLVRQRLALEAARNIDVVLFDKTGTLTKGEHGVVDVWPAQSYTVETVLSFGASVEAESEHSIAQAVVTRANNENIRIQKVQNFKAIPGKGVSGNLDGKIILVGGPQLLQTQNISLSDDLKSKVEQAGLEGKTVIHVLTGNQIVGVITTADIIRAESKEAVTQLNELGVRVAMLTGDSESVANYVAMELGIKEFFSQVLPENKSDKVKALQKDGSRVAMVGDGVNDAPALTQADVGIAIGAGTDVAIESAGIILAKSDPRDVVKIIKLSKATYNKMIQNLIWATGYNVFAIPLAAGVFGVILPAAVGALLMSVSTIVVALNTQLLRRLNLS